MPKRGRPRNVFLSDPDRYVLALASVFRELGASRRGAVEIAVACTEGRVVGLNRRPGRGHGLSMLELTYELPHTVNVNGITDRARELRRKMKAAIKDEDPASKRWLAAISGAWWIALQRGPVRLLLELAESVGELDYAHDVLLPVAGGLEARCRPKKARG
jgi:hypothetical protein